MVARDRLVSHDQAQRAADIAEVTRRCGDDDLTGEFAALEVGAALRLTRTAAQHEVAFAHDVTERLPEVGELLGSGRVDVRRARVLADGTAHLTAEAGRAGDGRSSRPGFRARPPVSYVPCCASCVWWPTPKTPRRRLERAVEDRRVVLEATPSGSANLLLLDLPPDVAAAARERIDFLARRLPATTGGAWISVAPTSPSTCSPGTASHWVGGWSTSPSICAPCWGWPSTPVSWVGGGRW